MFEREDNTERFFIDAVGWDREALELGLGWLVRYAKENGHDKAAIAVGIKDQINRMKPALPEQIADALHKQGEFVSADLTITVILDRRMPFDFRDGPILAVWKDDKRMETLDALGAPAICAIPWSEGNLDGWKAAWGPTDLRTGNAAETVSISSPVVEVALQHLTDAVNLSTGITHPSDREHAINVFRLLRDNGEPFDPDEIRAWATSHGWQPDDATELSDVARKIAEGRALRGGRDYLRKDAIDRWRNEAQN